jgi:parallel beta-helix repeat protein
MKTILAPRLPNAEPDSAPKHFRAEPDAGHRAAGLFGFRLSAVPIGPLAFLLAGLACTASARTIIVTTTNDSGTGSLRSAIQTANAFSGPDVIAFNIPGSGVQTIAPLTVLPPLDSFVTLNGYTQPGSRANTLATGSDARLLIRLDGQHCTSAQPYGLALGGNGNVVRGLVIVNFSQGIHLYASSVNTIAGNWIGLDVDGLPRGQTFEGIYVYDTSIANHIGGTAPADRNVISGNGTGIYLFGSTAQCIIEGNYIGTDATGSLPRPNTFEGVGIQSGGLHRIGGTAVGAGNVISGNQYAGIYVLGGTNITIQGNFIGVDATGTYTLGNGQDGVVIQSSSVSACTIGGTTAGAANVIAGNQNGIFILGAATNTIYGNFIGTDLTGTRPLGNLAAGISIFGGHHTLIGGASAGAANTIAYNLAGGVSATAQSMNNAIRGNHIFGNRGPGIDLNADGVTTNDLADADSGPNGLQNYPLLTNALVSASTVRVQGGFSGAASQVLTLDFYASTNWDFDGLAEGQRWLGSATRTTDAAGWVAFDVTLTATVPVDAQITATATDATGNTSEFSPAAAATAALGAPPLGLVSAGGTNYLVWPANAPGIGVEASLALGAAASWFPVTTGIVTLGTNKFLPLVPTPGVSNEFFRLTAP